MNDRLPRNEPKWPSSSAHAATSTPPPSARATSSPYITPSAPSSQPACGWVSTWLPSSSFGALAPRTTDDVADAVDRRIQPASLHPRHQPVARLHILRRIGRPMHAGLVFTDLAQRVEVAQQPLAIDARVHGAITMPCGRDQPIRRRRESRHLVRQRPKPLRMIQHDMRPIGEIHIDQLPIQRLPLRDIRHAPRARQQIVEFRIAVFPPVQEPVARQPDRDIPVRIRTTAPDHHRRLVLRPRAPPQPAHSLPPPATSRRTLPPRRATGSPARPAAPPDCCRSAT